MSRPKVHPPQFIAVTADEYELTLGAFDTVKELAAWSGHKVFAIYQSLEYGRVLRRGPAKGCKVLRYTDGHYTAGILKPKPPAAGTTPTAGGFYALGYSGTASHENGNSLSASPCPFHLVW